MRKIVSLILISIFVLIYSCSENNTNSPDDNPFVNKDWTEYFPLKEGAYWIYGYCMREYKDNQNVPPDYYDTVIVEKKMIIMGHEAYYLKSSLGFDKYFYFDGPYLYELKEKYKNKEGSIWVMVADFNLKEESKPKVFNWNENQGDLKSDYYSKLLITNSVKRNSDTIIMIMDSIYAVSRYINTIYYDYTEKSGKDNLDGYKLDITNDSYYIKNVGLVFTLKTRIYWNFTGSSVKMSEYWKLIEYNIP